MWQVSNNESLLKIWEVGGFCQELNYWETSLVESSNAAESDSLRDSTYKAVEIEN